MFVLGQKFTTFESYYHKILDNHEKNCSDCNIDFDLLLL